MRRVKVFKMVEKEYSPEQALQYCRKTYWDKEWSYEGTFIQYGIDTEEYEYGPGNFTAAVIEKDNGEVDLVPLHLIRFVSEQELGERRHG